MKQPLNMDPFWSTDWELSNGNNHTNSWRFQVPNEDWMHHFSPRHSLGTSPLPTAHGQFGYTWILDSGYMAERWPVRSTAAQNVWKVAAVCHRVSRSPPWWHLLQNRRGNPPKMMRHFTDYEMLIPLVFGYHYESQPVPPNLDQVSFWGFPSMRLWAFVLRCSQCSPQIFERWS